MTNKSARSIEGLHLPSASTLQAAAAIFGSAIINNDARFRAPPPSRNRPQ